jgi:hypothetical protein
MDEGLTLEWILERLPEDIAKDYCLIHGVSYKEVSERLGELETRYYPHEYEFRGMPDEKGV